MFINAAITVDLGNDVGFICQGQNITEKSYAIKSERSPSAAVEPL